MRGRGVGRPALLALVIVGAAAGAAAGIARHPHLGREVSAADAPGRAELMAETLSWSDRFWDEREGLLSAPPHAERGGHLVRESAWYACGLLEAGRPGDVQRASRILDRVARLQLRAPGEEFDGTFPRTTEEAAPALATSTRSFDPNWREFVGTAMALALLRHGDAMPWSLQDALWAAVALAARSEPRDGRALATNVALMQAFALTAAAAHGRHDDDLRSRGEAILDPILADARRYGTVREYDSPTYYGIDLYAATLFARYGSDATLRRKGMELADVLWADISRRYSPSLRNLCGPYSRAYGIDMTRYVALLGMWIWAETDRAHAPVPLDDDPLHDHDRLMGPVIASIALDVTPPIREGLLRPAVPHEVDQPLPGDEGTSRCWAEDGLLIGGLEGPPQAAAFPVTVHWRAPSGEVGWLVARDQVERATVRRRSVDVAFAASATFSLSPPGAEIRGDRWVLPGLTLRVSGGCSFRVERLADREHLWSPGCRSVSLEVVDERP